VGPTTLADPAFIPVSTIPLPARLVGSLPTTRTATYLPPVLRFVLATAGAALHACDDARWEPMRPKIKPLASRDRRAVGGGVPDAGFLLLHD